MRTNYRNRQYYKTEEEKQKFISESFQLDTNEILNKDAKLKEAVIQLFLDNSTFSPHILTNTVKLKYWR